jgi:hypothetical protein
MRRIVLANWALFLGIGLLLVANGLLLTLLTVRANELGFSATAIGVMQRATRRVRWRAPSSRRG